MFSFGWFLTLCETTNKVQCLGLLYFLYWSYHGSHKFCACCCHHWLNCDIFLILMKTLQAFHFSIILFFFCFFWLWGFVLWMVFYWKQWSSNLGGRTWRLCTFHIFFALRIFCYGYIWSTKLAILTWEDPFFRLHFFVFVFSFAHFQAL